MRVADLARLSGCHPYIDDPHFLVRRPLVKALDSATKYAHGALLDIGCGNKPYEELFAGKVSRYFGVDVIQSHLHKVDLLCPANAIPLQSESFDTVFSTQTIEHVADHRKLVSEAFRLLRPTGCFIVSGPLYWPLHEEPYDFFRITKHGFDWLLSEAGFKVVEIIPNGGKWATLGQVIIHTIQHGPLDRRSVIKLINKIFYRLDDRYFDPVNTPNYVAIGRKPRGNGAERQ